MRQRAGRSTPTPISGRTETTAPARRSMPFFSADSVRTKRWPNDIGRCQGQEGDEPAGKPDSVITAGGDRRSSICDRCCQRPGAIYQETRASSPQAFPQAYRVRPFDLAPGGVYRATPVTWGAGGLLHHRFTLTSRTGEAMSTSLARGAVCFLWHCPAGHPGWALPTTVLYGVRTFLSYAPFRGRNRDRLAGFCDHRWR
jgi:hypothetical protein